MCKRKKLVGCVANSLVVVLLLVACTGADTGAMNSAAPAATTQAETTQVEITQATDSATDTPVEAEKVIQTQYMQLCVPEAKMEGVTHREVVQDTIAMEIFTLVSGETELELFRLYFGDGTMGTIVGYVTVEEEEIPVSYTISEYGDDFPDEESKALYYQAMDLFSVVIDALYESENFSQTKHTEPVKDGVAAMKYWSVDLPENIIWEELVQEKLYCLNFYGTLHGERTALYSVGIGEMEADYTVGTFLVDGEERIVNVRIFDLPVTDQWNEEEISAGYRMLETVNDVIDAIMSSENFSEQMPE